MWETGLMRKDIETLWTRLERLEGIVSTAAWVHRLRSLSYQAWVAVTSEKDSAKAVEILIEYQLWCLKRRHQQIPELLGVVDDIMKLLKED